MWAALDSCTPFIPLHASASGRTTAQTPAKQTERDGKYPTSFSPFWSYSRAGKAPVSFILPATRSILPYVTSRHIALQGQTNWSEPWMHSFLFQNGSKISEKGCLPWMVKVWNFKFKVVPHPIEIHQFPPLFQIPVFLLYNCWLFTFERGERIFFKWKNSLKESCRKLKENIWERFKETLKIYIDYRENLSKS